MSCKPNPHENPRRRNKKKPGTRPQRTVYTGRRDAAKAAKQRGGNSRPYQVKGGWSITRR